MQNTKSNKQPELISVNRPDKVLAENNIISDIEKVRNIAKRYNKRSKKGVENRHTMIILECRRAGVLLSDVILERKKNIEE